MKKTRNSFDDLVKAAPKLEMRVGLTFPNAFREKMAESEKIMSSVGLPKSSKK